jgi:hypothetical protein
MSYELQIYVAGLGIYATHAHTHTQKQAHINWLTCISLLRRGNISLRARARPAPSSLPATCAPNSLGSEGRGPRCPRQYHVREETLYISWTNRGGEGEWEGDEKMETKRERRDGEGKGDYEISERIERKIREKRVR